jgi:hypothetical protein
MNDGTNYLESSVLWTCSERNDSLNGTEYSITSVDALKSDRYIPNQTSMLHSHWWISIDPVDDVLGNPEKSRFRPNAYSVTKSWTTKCCYKLF